MKKYIAKLKTNYVYKTLKNNYFLLAIAVTLAVIAFNYWYVLLIFLFFLIYLHCNKAKLILKISITLSLIVVIHLSINTICYQPKQLTNIEGLVIDVKQKENSNLLIVKKGAYKVYIYASSNQNIKPGYIIKAQGELLEMQEARIINGFDYKNYLIHKKVLSIIATDTVTIVKKGIHLNLVKYYAYKYVNKLFDDEVKMIVEGFVLGDDSDFSDTFSKAIEKNAIMHLFAVSGLHVSILINSLETVTKKIKLSNRISIIILSVVLFIYMLITSFSASILRAGLIYYLKQFNEKNNLGLQSLDRISIIYIALILINPFYAYDLGFILSFIMAFFIILYSPLISKNTTLTQGFKISLLATLVTFPIVININPTINLLSPFVNVLFIEIVSLLVLPLTFIVFVLPFIQPIYSIIIKGFIQLVIITSKFAIPISFSAIPFILTVIFYIALIYFTIKRNKIALASLIITVVIIYAFPVTLKKQIHFLDLENGESIIINDPGGVVVIDTGDGTNNEVTSFIKKQGIKTIEYLIITHGHDDHNGEALNIISEINVNKLVVNAYDNSEIVKSYLQVSKNKNIKLLRVKKGDQLSTEYITFNVLSPEESALDENDESIVMSAKINDLNYLFLGDATKEIELKIINQLNKVDVIKIAHHGSKTSTADKLIEKLRPKYAIIQAGRVEKFAFPHQETIETLNTHNIMTYRTDVHYSITINYSKNKSIIKTLK